jgi:hypothetical protein
LKNSYKTLHDTLLEERALQQTLASPTYKLPSETLSTIFLYAVSSPPQLSFSGNWSPRQKRTRELADIFFSISLAAVCSRWRHVTFSTPHLWAHFEFPETLWTRKPIPCHLLSLYLLNSKQIPLHLSLSFSTQAGHKAPDSTLFHPSLDRALISNSARIQSLSLQHPPLRWLEQLGDFPFIVDLSIDYWSGTPGDIKGPLQLHRCHALSRLSLGHTAVNACNKRILYHVPTSLTVLDFSTMPIDICIKTMLRCPNLVEAYIHCPEEEQNDEHTLEEIKQAWFTQPVVFNHLTVLLWSQNPHDWSVAFLQQLKTPKLHTLKLTIVDDLDTLEVDTAGDACLIEQLPATLKTLEIENVRSIGVDTLGRLFNSQSSVEHLVLSECDVEVLECIFNALSEFNGTTDPIYLPYIKSFWIRDCFKYDGDELEGLENYNLDSLIRALEHRLGEGRSFRLEFSGFGVDWTPGAQARLRGLVEKGARLEIIEDGEQVQWLNLI